MMKDLQIKGTTNFMGIELPNVYGGFGEDKKCILAKSVAEIHEVELKDINRLINSNIDEFENGVDILDLKSNGEYYPPFDLGFSNRDISISKNIYMLSESGYMALVMLMRTERAKEIRKQLRKEYFLMKDVINSDEQLKKDLLLKIFNGGADGIEASRRLLEIAKENAVKVIKLKLDLADKLLESKNSYDIGTFAKVLNIKGLGRNNFFKYLKENKIIFENGKEPYQAFAHYFDVSYTPITTRYRTTIMATKLRLNAKGIEYMTKRLIKEGYIVTKSIEQILKELKEVEIKVA